MLMPKYEDDDDHTKCQCMTPSRRSFDRAKSRWYASHHLARQSQDI